jgi:inner membrane protein
MVRAFFPRVSRTTTVGVLVAGTAADFDTLSAQISPSTFLKMNHTWGHSLISAAVIGLIAGVTCVFLAKRQVISSVSRTTIFAAMLCAAALHLLLDMCQSSGAALLWPFSLRRFAADWLPQLDIWLILVLLAALLLPNLFGLITDEIGAKPKGIRGRKEAVASLLVIALYICLRMVTHAEAVVVLASRSYGGELARTAAALPGSQSPFRWMGMVETESAWHFFDVAVAPGGNAQVTGDRIAYKPEDSPTLQAARLTQTARRFLQRARFPKATVEKNEAGGARVTLREAFADRYSTGSLVMAVVDLDSNGKILQEGLAWDAVAK